MSRKNECLIAIINVLDDAQIAYIVRHGGKHLHVLFTVNGRKQRCICPLSSSDVNAQYAARAQIRRMVRS